MTLNEFIQQINESIPQELRDEISLDTESTASETLACISEYCTEFYQHLGQKLPEWLLDTFDHKQLIAHNLHVNAIRIAGNYDRSKTQRFLYTIPVPTRFDKEIYLCQYGNVDVTVTRGTVSIYDNRSNVKIQTGAIVSLFGQSKATVEGKAIVEAHDSTYLTVQGNPMVKAKGNCYIVVNGDATIEAKNDVNIEIQGGSPIILADNHVRIANCVKPEAGQNVRILLDKTVLLVTYSNSGTIINHMASSQVAQVLSISENDPTMEQFIENMRSRYESQCKGPGRSDELFSKPNLLKAKNVLIGLTQQMPQTESKFQIQSALSEATTHLELLDTIVSNMDLFVNSGLNQYLLENNFTYIDLLTKGIWTNPAFLHHLKSKTKEIYLFGHEHFPIKNKDISIHAYEHTAILGNSGNVDLHDHSLSLSQSYGTINQTDHSIVSGVNAKTLTLSGHSFASLSEISMANVHDKATLLNYQHTDIVSLSEQAQAYHYNPPMRINKNSETSQLHYVRNEDNPLVMGTHMGIITYNKDADLTAELKNYQAQKTAQTNKKQRGRKPM